MESIRRKEVPLEIACSPITHSDLDEKIKFIKEKIKECNLDLANFTAKRNISNSKANFKESINCSVEREEDKQGCCRRTLQHLSNLFQKSDVKKEAKFYAFEVELQREITNKKRKINTLSKELEKLEKVQRISETLSHSFKVSVNYWDELEEDSLNKLRQFISSTPKEILADAVRQVFKKQLNYINIRALRIVLSNMYPSSTKFISFGLTGKIILPQGSRIIVDLLQKKGSHGKEAAINLPCHIFDEPVSFVEHIQKSADGESDSPQILLVRCNNPQITHRGIQLSCHTTPLLFEKTEDGNIILIWTDSTAGFKYLESEMAAIEKTLKKKGLKLNLFFLEEARQNDGNTCSAFSINDAIGFSKHHRELISFCKQCILEKLDPSEYRYRIPLEQLPQRFIWPIQTSKLANQYRKTLSPSDQEIFDSKYNKYLIETSNQSKHNHRSELVNSKYEGIIWQTIIKKSNTGLIPFVKSLFGY